MAVPQIRFDAHPTGIVVIHSRCEVWNLERTADDFGLGSGLINLLQKCWRVDSMVMLGGGIAIADLLLLSEAQMRRIEQVDALPPMARSSFGLVNPPHMRDSTL
jgi:hypothetical protein